ncbi:MAG TPA: FAD-dependent oxidoreductase [Dermatophilaceae bacterium]|nr:FAD-dependent oxidoreductase [Dermatophilaceae bacterium]
MPPSDIHDGSWSHLVRPSSRPGSSGRHPRRRERADTVVVGAGITGLTTALLLKRSGQSVLVLEDRHIGAVTTGHSTAKLSLLYGQV